MVQEHKTNKAMDNLEKYTGITAMKGLFHKKEDPAPQPISESQEFRVQQKKTAEDFKKESHKATLNKLQEAANKLCALDKEDEDSLIAELLSMSKDIETTTKLCAASERSRDDNGEKFYRTTFSDVYVTSPEDEGVEGVLSMKTRTDIQDKVFPALPKLPEILTDLVPPVGGPYESYKSYIEKVLLLQDDFVKPFLCILRVHLNDYQLALATIEAWLREPESDTAFLNDLFGTTLKTPQTKQYDFFRSETFHLLTTASPGDMKLHLSVSTDKGKLRHLVAFAKPATPVGASTTSVYGGTGSIIQEKAPAADSDVGTEIVVSDKPVVKEDSEVFVEFKENQDGVAKNKGCLNFFKLDDDSKEAAEF